MRRRSGASAQSRSSNGLLLLWGVAVALVCCGTAGYQPFLLSVEAAGRNEAQAGGLTALATDKHEERECVLHPGYDFNILSGKYSNEFRVVADRRQEPCQQSIDDGSTIDVCETVMKPILSQYDPDGTCLIEAMCITLPNDPCAIKLSFRVPISHPATWRLSETWSYMQQDPSCLDKFNKALKEMGVTSCYYDFYRHTPDDKKPFRISIGD